MSQSQERPGTALSRREFLRRCEGAFLFVGLSGEKERTKLEQVAGSILSRQAADGAIWMGGGEKIVPYFAHLAALGLLAAHAVVPKPAYLSAVGRWLDWYDAQRNPDGTVWDYVGKPGAWHATSDRDSTDSYAAVYMEIVAGLHRARPDLTALRRRYASVRLSARALELTLRANGLTLAKPDYPVWYTMDNIEVYRGWHAAEQIAHWIGENADAQRYARRAAGSLHALDTLLWDEQAQRYLVGLQPDGGRAPAGNEWYPGQMVNLMAVAWLPRSERRKALFTRMRQAYPDLPEKAASEGDLDVLLWWAMAARNANDDTLFRTLVDRLQTFDPEIVSLYNPGLYGHLCRVLSSPML